MYQGRAQTENASNGPGRSQARRPFHPMPSTGRKSTSGTSPLAIAASPRQAAAAVKLKPLSPRANQGIDNNTAAEKNTASGKSVTATWLYINQPALVASIAVA